METVSQYGPEREPGPDTSVVHYDTDTLDLVTGCGQNILELSGGDSYSTDPAAVDCPACSAKLVDGQLAEPAQLGLSEAWDAAYADEPWASMIPDPHPMANCGPLAIGALPPGVRCPTCGTLPKPPMADAPAEPRHSAEVGDVFTRCNERVSQVARWTDDPATPVDCEPCRAALARYGLVADETVIAPAVSTRLDDAEQERAKRLFDHGSAIEEDKARTAAERRTVGLEVLTDELRAVGSPEGVPADARVGVILRRDGRPVVVADTDAPWVAARHGDEPVYLLRGLLSEMISGAARLRREHERVELLMPTPDVLAALAGQPVGRWTATVPSRWGVVQPGWLVLIETMVDHERDSVWLLVEDRVECPDPDCPVAQGSPWSCAVVTIRGRGIQHLNAFVPCSVRIPADQPAPDVAVTR